LRLKTLNKLRTASLNSEFTGSYKKKCNKFSNIAKRWGFTAPSAY